MDGDAVLRPHLVELVDAHHAVVSQHHGAPLHTAAPRPCISGRPMTALQHLDREVDRPWLTLQEMMHKSCKHRLC